MNISRKITDYVRLESRYYRIFADRCFSASLEPFAAAADARLEKMECFLGGEPASSARKILYFIERAEENEKNRGQAFADDRIVCFFDGTQDISGQLLPFVHEEMHVITARRFGVLPAFWNEGIAERVVVLLKGDCWDAERLRILEMNIALSEGMYPVLSDMLWTMDDGLYQKYRRRYMTGYVFAALAVDYLMNTYGRETFFSYMGGLEQQKDMFVDFLRRENVFSALIESGKRLIAWESGENGVL